MKFSKNTILLSILIIFYTVGIVGMFVDENRFLPLSSMNLYLSLGLCLFSVKRWNRSKFIVFLSIALGGYIIELIGVHTSYLFGHYAYGKNLGFKLFEIPVVLTANWLMLCLGSTALFHKLKISPFFKAFLSASVMTLLDVLIEPVAVHSDFWHWFGQDVPLYNYVCWFLFSYLFHFLLFKTKQSEQNPVLIGLISIQFVFFGILNFK